MPASWMQALEKELWGHSSLRYNRTFISDENWKIVSPYRNNSLSIRNYFKTLETRAALKKENKSKQRQQNPVVRSLSDNHTFKTLIGKKKKKRKCMRKDLSSNGMVVLHIGKL
jgi:hypothetical protein